jgi:ABC-type multidrug transport system ATPase subunit
MDTHLDHEDYEHEDHEMVPMHSADFGDNGDDDDELDVGNAVGAAALTGSSSLGSTAATTMRSSGLSAIEFNNVNVYVPPSFFQGCCGGAKGVPKHILRDISGRLQAPAMVAVLGPSGGGKTTFIRTVSGHADHSVYNIRGSVVVDDQPLTPKLAREFGYVLQHEKLHPNLTVWEALMFSALLGLPRTLTYQEKKQRVKQVLRSIGLHKVKKSMIGDTEEGLSGGERRRLAIGIELLKNSKILFLDEPTSGLDAHSAYYVMELLKELAMDNRLVVTSIHQPREEIFQMFTHVMLFYEGRMLFLGTQPQLKAFFTLHGLVVPKGMSSADYMVDLACRGEFPEWDPTDLPQGDGESEESPFDDESRSSGFVEAELKSPRSKGVVSKGKNYSKLKEKLPEVGIDDDNFLNDDFVDDGGQQGASLSMQFLVLMYRSILINLRDGANCWMLLIIGAAVAAIAALMFRYIESSDFLFLRNAYFLGCFYVVDLPSFSLHRWYTDVEFFRHELNNGYYRLFPLFIAETLVTDLLKYFFIAFTFSSLFYPIVPFEHSFDGWLYAFVIYYLGAQCFISIARLLTCTLVWDESYSHSAYGFCGVVIGLTCGVLVMPNDLPPVYNWAYAINPMSYMINGLTLHEFKGRLTGDDAKKLDELWPQNPWENVIIVFCYYLFLRVVIFLAMFWIRRNRPSMGYYIKRCFGSRAKPVYH